MFGDHGNWQRKKIDSGIEMRKKKERKKEIIIIIRENE